jgi:glycosyltransferase involved in cell wall biosynthesis
MNPYFSSFHNHQESIEQNFDVSVIMPFYKKLEAFKRVFPKNRKYFERNGIEVVIVLDCPAEKEELTEYIQAYPFVNWKILYNDQPHEWRNPTKPINVGIRFATKKYIMVCSPESEFFTDAILQLRTGLQNYPNHYAIGTVCFAENEELIDDSTVLKHHFMPYGSIMAEKQHFCQINGYDETLNRWGGDDDNVRARLELSGIDELSMLEVKLIHRDDNTDGNARRTTPLDILEKLRYPKITIVNPSWGHDFDTILYDWQTTPCEEQLVKQYLSQFLDYDLQDNVLGREYGRILLLPAYNEKNNLTRFFRENADHFDAIILLDDESTDGTYTMASHDKLILKIRKRRKEFNDLENRNILLNLVSFFKHHWACFVDADEIIDSRYADFDSFTDKKKHRFRPVQSGPFVG